MLPAMVSASVTVTTPQGPVTVPLPVIYLALATLFHQWWDEDRASEQNTQGLP